MIERILIENFKSLKKIEFDNVKRVNLIGGRNNSGKSTLLEAVFFFFDRLSADQTMRHLAWRGIQKLDLEPEKMWSPLFYNFEMQNAIKIKISKEIMFVNSDKNYKPKLADKENNILLENVGNLSTQQNFSLSVKVSENNKELFKSYHTISGLNIEKNTSKLEIAAYLSGRTFNAAELISEFNKTDEMGETGELVEALKIIDERVENLSLNMAGGVSVIYAKINGIDRKIPAALLGDGINRLLAIIIKIKTCKNGVVLIDEIENGFHYSTMTKIWELINKLSKKYNCQIFAATHSYECLKAAFDCFESSKDDFQYIRMAKSKTGEITPKIYDYDVLESAIENDLEVR